MQSPLYDLWNSPAIKNFRATMETVNRLDGLIAQRDRFVDTMVLVQTKVVQARQLYRLPLIAPYIPAKVTHKKAVPDHSVHISRVQGKYCSTCEQMRL